MQVVAEFSMWLTTVLFLKNKWTPLHAAARNGCASVVETLVKSGADANAALVVSVIFSTITIEHNSDCT